MKRIRPKRIKGMIGTEEFFRNSIEEYNRFKWFEASNLIGPSKEIQVWTLVFKELQEVEIFIFHDSPLRKAAGLQVFSQRGLTLSKLERGLEKDRERIIKFLKKSRQDLSLSQLEEKAVRKSLMIKAKIEKILRQTD